MQPESFSSEFVISEIELIYKSKVTASKRPRVTSSQAIYALFLQLWDTNKIDFIEEFKVLFLNRGNGVLGVYNVSSGGITGTVADVRIVFAAALKLNATSIVACHNHPSGLLRPSRMDEELTHDFKDAGRILCIKLVDHLIISREGYFSFAEEGAL